jgi:hypothetical protein
MMKRAIPLLVASLFALACEDEPSKPTVVPTAPATAAPIASGSISASDLGSGASTICRVYVTERDVAKAQLDSAATDTLMLRRVKSLDALVKETCN